MESRALEDVVEKVLNQVRLRWGRDGVRAVLLGDDPSTVGIFQQVPGWAGGLVLAFALESGVEPSILTVEYGQYSQEKSLTTADVASLLGGSDTFIAVNTPTSRGSVLGDVPEVKTESEADELGWTIAHADLNDVGEGMSVHTPLGYNPDEQTYRVKIFTRLSGGRWRHLSILRGEVARSRIRGHTFNALLAGAEIALDQDGTRAF